MLDLYLSNKSAVHVTKDILIKRQKSSDKYI